MQQIPASVAARLRALGRLVGNTSMIGVEFKWGGKPRVVYAKAEWHNLTGSIKDRMALHIVRQAYLDGRLHPGDTIAEATSGNTGISFCAIGRALGHPVTIFMPDWMSRERIDLISSFGATIVPVSHAQGGFLGSICLSEDLARQRPHVFLPCQFSNQANVDAHRTTTGPEIWAQLRMHGRTPDAFVAGVGTGGTVMGVGQALRARRPEARIHPLEPSESPTLSTGKKVGKHRIQGISDEFIPAIVKLEALDPVVGVRDGDAILMAQKLARELGFAVGISSGANFLGALMVQNDLGDDATVVTVFSDSNKKYLTTDLLREEPVRPDYLSQYFELTGFHVLPPLCAFCDVEEAPGAAVDARPAPVTP